MKLCLNCLEQGPTIRAVPVGAPSGSQRDPVQRTLDLCETCRGALVEGELGILAQRYAYERTVSR